MWLDYVTYCDTLMAVTPEGKVKAKLRSILDGYAGTYTYWPVPTGFGATTLDVLGCYRGRFFAVETKAKGKKPTLRQTGELQKIERAMGRAFVMSGPEDPAFDELVRWLDDLTRDIPDDPHLTPDPVNRRAI
jgi:hypothetical protein